MEVMDKISEKYQLIDEMIERIGDAENIEETAALAVELYGTLGFCHGFMGKHVMVFPESKTTEFPWNPDTLFYCKDDYLTEYKTGENLRKEMESDENESI